MQPVLGYHQLYTFVFTFKSEVDAALSSLLSAAWSLYLPLKIKVDAATTSFCHDTPWVLIPLKTG